MLMSCLVFSATTGKACLVVSLQFFLWSVRHKFNGMYHLLTSVLTMTRLVIPCGPFTALCGPMQSDVIISHIAVFPVVLWHSGLYPVWFCDVGGLYFLCFCDMGGLYFVWFCDMGGLYFSVLLWHGWSIFCVVLWRGWSIFCVALWHGWSIFCVILWCRGLHFLCDRLAIDDVLHNVQADWYVIKGELNVDKKVAVRWFVLRNNERNSPSCRPIY